MDSLLQQQIVEAVIARLQKRTGKVARLTAGQLRQADCQALALDNDTLHLAQISLPQLKLFAEHQPQDGVALKLHEMLCLGVRVRITLPQHLLRAVPADALSHLPVKWCDEQELPIVLHPATLLSYADVAALPTCWLVLRRHCVITALAQETAQVRNIHLIKQE